MARCKNNPVDDAHALKKRENGDSGIARKLILLFSLVAVAILTCAYFYYQYQANQVRVEAERQIATVAELKVNELITWKDERFKDAAFYQHNLSLSALAHRYFDNPEDDATEEELRSWFRVTQSSHGYGIFVTDGAGDIILSLPPDQAALEASVRELIPEAFQKGEVAFVDFYRSEETDRVHFGLIVPMVAPSPSSDREAVLVWRLDPANYLDSLLQSWPTSSETAETFLIRKEGEELVVLSELRFKENSALALRFPLDHPTLPEARIVQGATGVVEGIDYRGTPIFALGRPVPGTPWHLVTNIDQWEIEAQLQERFWWMVAIVGALLASSGTGIGLLWRHQSARNDRERVRAAEVLHEQSMALRKAHDLLNFHLENSPMGVVEWDREFRVSRWSDQATKLFGWSSQEVMGKNPNEWAFIHPDDVDEVSRVMNELMSGATPRNHNRNRNLTRSGSIIYCDWHNSVRVDEQGGTSILSMIQDVTDRVVARQELAELNNELEERVQIRTAQLEAANVELESFSYSVSHDLRAPLRSIAGFSQALQEHVSAALDPKALGYLRRVRNAADRMGKLIDDLLKLSRLTRMEVQRTTIDLSAMAHSILGELQRNDPERKVTAMIAPGLQIQADHALTEILLGNLLENAWKFTRHREEAVIEVGEIETADGNGFFVRDNGAGFDMQYVHKLFSAFQRLHAESEFPGTGIGLAIVQRIVARHGGEVRAESKINNGSTFYVNL